MHTSMIHRFNGCEKRDYPIICPRALELQKQNKTKKKRP